MTTRTRNTTFGWAAALSLSALMTQAAPAGVFAFRIDNAGGSDGVDNDGQSFQQQWGSPTNWNLVSGVDDGGNGYPDATDTFTMDRTTLANNSTRLTTESAPGSLNFVAGITGTGTGNQDIVFKSRDFTIGDLTVLASANPFTIREERDKSLTINGVISGAGGLRLLRSGSFSDGVDPDELFTIGGSSLNTITGPIHLFNDNAAQPGFWVADKVGAFGQSSEVTLEGNSGATGIQSLRITTSAIGGEGAIDDDATIFRVGRQGLLSIDAGVNEAIGEGNLFVDLLSDGTYTEIAPGTYNNSEAWITGDGTVTVIPEPSSFALVALGVLGLMRRKR
ncbi:MAG: hypothetical protein ACI8XO_003214 [Verrucomicrobiales bacterium]|jgi:hypothetical protein